VHTQLVRWAAGVLPGDGAPGVAALDGDAQPVAVAALRAVAACQPGIAAAVAAGAGTGAGCVGSVPKGALCGPGGSARAGSGAAVGRRGDVTSSMQPVATVAAAAAEHPIFPPAADAGSPEALKGTLAVPAALVACGLDAAFERGAYSSARGSHGPKVPEMLHPRAVAVMSGAALGPSAASVLHVAKLDSPAGAAAATPRSHNAVEPRGCSRQAALGPAPHPSLAHMAGLRGEAHRATDGISAAAAAPAAFVALVHRLGNDPSCMLPPSVTPGVDAQPTCPVAARSMASFQPHACSPAVSWDTASEWQQITPAQEWRCRPEPDRKAPEMLLEL
jgi:hypothetical protein